MSGTAWGNASNERDRDVIDHLLTCPRCAELCPDDCRYCAECGSRLLPNECYHVPSLDAPYDYDLESPSDAHSP